MEQTNLITALLAALEQHIRELVTQQVTAVLAAQPTQPKQETEAVVDMDKLRELVAPIVASQVEAAVEEAIADHTSDYDHEEYDSAVRTLSDYDLDDLDNFVTHDDVKTKIEEAVDEKVDDMLDDKIEDKVRKMLCIATVKIEV